MTNEASSVALGAHHPQGKELGAASIGVAQGQPGPLHLALAGVPSHLQGGLGKADHARGADGVGGQYAAGAVPGNVAALIQAGGALMGLVLYITPLGTS